MANIGIVDAIVTNGCLILVIKVRGDADDIHIPVKWRGAPVGMVDEDIRGFTFETSLVGVIVKLKPELLQSGWDDEILLFEVKVDVRQRR